MIPKIIHYCWFGKGQMPELVLKCIESWNKYLPNYEMHLWNEDNFDIASAPQYVQEAYAAKKYAFVSDYVRLWALEQEGGVYLDTDVEVLRSFDPLLGDTAFIGLEESLALLPGTCVMGCEANCKWVKDMLATYENATFLKEDGSLDMTTNVQRLGAKMVEGGMQHERKIQYLPQWGLRIYTHDYFSPITSTRVMRKTKNTYCIHRFAGSWVDGKNNGIRNWWITREMMNILIQIKRLIVNCIR